MLPQLPSAAPHTLSPPPSPILCPCICSLCHITASLQLHSSCPYIPLPNVPTAPFPRVLLSLTPQSPYIPFPTSLYPPNFPKSLYLISYLCLCFSIFPHPNVPIFHFPHPCTPQCPYTLTSLHPNSQYPHIPIPQCPYALTSRCPSTPLPHTLHPISHIPTSPSFPYIPISHS